MVYWFKELKVNEAIYKDLLNERMRITQISKALIKLDISVEN